MPKKLSETEKKEMITSFCNGMTIDQLSDKYKITKEIVGAAYPQIVWGGRS